MLALVFLVIFSVFSKQHGREPEIVFSDFMSAVDRGDIQEVVIQGHNIQGKYKNGERFRTFAPTDPDLVKSLRDKKVKIAAKPEDDQVPKIEAKIKDGMPEAPRTPAAAR